MEKGMKAEEKALMTDDEIVDMYWARNEKAIDHTDKKYGKYLFSIAYNILAQELDCEECVNDTYLNTQNAIEKGNYWNKNTQIIAVHCTDGDVSIS